MQQNEQKLNNCVKVYVSDFDTNVQVVDVAPPIRNEMIQRCTDTLTKQQRYCVWVLLDYALRINCGKGVDGLEFSVSSSGKWRCNNGVRFSLSHCNNVVAVAVCNDEVGVDIQFLESFARNANSADFVARILTDSEQRLLCDVSAEKRTQALATIWTQKESIFKQQESNAFVPRAIDTTKFAPHSQIVTINGEKYALSVAARLYGGASKLTVDLERVKLWNTKGEA